MKLHKLPTEQELEQERMAKLRQKLRAMVVETEGPLATPCWIWKGRIDKDGYGWVGWEGEDHGTHRLSYLAFCGPIPHYRIICHICNVRACVQPAHLYAGMDASNMAVRQRAGGFPRGEEHHNIVLTEANVFAILALLHKGYSAKSIAKQFGVSRQTIHDIAVGRTWTRLARPEGFAPRTNRKLTEAQVQEIRALLAAGHTNTAIAPQFGVTRTTIHAIATGRTWRRISRK